MFSPNPLRTLVLNRARRRPALCLAGLLVFLGLGCDTGTGLDALSGSAPPAGAAPMDATSPEADGLPAPDAVARDIEEADVVKIVADKLYALNRYKGLLVIDVADPDNPRLLGSFDLRGRGVEMYVIGNRVYALLSADFFFFMNDMPPVGGPAAQGIVPDGPTPPPPDFDGSQIAVIDVSDAAHPALEGKINLAGFANESRRVGDILYVIGSSFGPFFADNSGDAAGAGEGFVASIDVGDPTSLVPVERKNLSGDALMMHVSDTAIFAASRAFDFDSSETLTDIQVVDISDPAGAIVLRDAFTVPGSIRNRFYMDAFEGVFRIATESFGFGLREVRVWTYSLADLDQVTALGQTTLVENESLRAVRFDGPRGYVVTFFQVDPLFVVDLRDPANPTVNGELQVPGFSTHIEPRGDRLIAVGVDDTDGRRPAVSYYDVSDPANPRELGRVLLGPPGSFTSSEATYDEKAFKIVDELGLIVIPFRHVEFDDDIVFFEGGPPMMAGGPAANDIAPPTPPVCMNGVQLVDFNDQALTQRGWFENEGRVRRVGVIGDRVFALSQVSLQTVDITDRDQPKATGRADFFSEAEMPLFEECGIGFPIEPGPFEVSPNSMMGLLRMLDICGAMGGLPAALLPVGLLMFISRRRWTA
ncbi:MAG: beta-propeller domain-containing protein [Phycisphaerae bacterium]